MHDHSLNEQYKIYNKRMRGLIWRGRRGRDRHYGSWIYKRVDCSL
jgi:hypothetical protein